LTSLTAVFGRLACKLNHYFLRSLASSFSTLDSSLSSWRVSSIRRLISTSSEGTSLPWESCS